MHKQLTDKAMFERGYSGDLSKFKNGEYMCQHTARAWERWQNGYSEGYKEAAKIPAENNAAAHTVDRLKEECAKLNRQNVVLREGLRDNQIILTTGNGNSVVENHATDSNGTRWVKVEYVNETVIAENTKLREALQRHGH